MVRNQLKDEKNKGPMKTLDDTEFFRTVRFPKYHCAGIYDIYPVTRDYSFIHGTADLNKEYKTANKRALAIKVFHEFMRSVLEGVVENNDMLILPAYDACICAEGIPEKIWKNRRKKNKFMHFDALATGGKVFSTMYRYKKMGKCHRFEIVLDRARFKRFVAHQNSGKKYFDHADIW